MNNEARRLRACAIDSASRAIAADDLSPLSLKETAREIIDLADRLYAYIDTGEVTQPAPASSPYQYQPTAENLAEMVTEAQTSPSEPIGLPRVWNNEAVLTHFKQNGFSQAELHDSGDADTIVIVPYPLSPDERQDLPEQDERIIKDEVKHGYSFQALLASAKTADKIVLDGRWNADLILTGFVQAGYVHATLHFPLGKAGTYLYPGELDLP